MVARKGGPARPRCQIVPNQQGGGQRGKKSRALQLRALNDSGTISLVTFEAPKKRREGPGIIADKFAFATFKLHWRDEEITAIKAEGHWFHLSSSAGGLGD